DPRNFLRHQRLEQLLGFLHRRARQMIRATPSRKSRSDLSKALTFALSTLITPRTRSCSSSIMGTITSDFVDQKFGKKQGSLRTSGTMTVRRSSFALALNPWVTGNRGQAGFILLVAASMSKSLCLILLTPTQRYLPVCCSNSAI